MERLSDKAIEIINELHTERLDYESEYLPLIECAQKCAAYEDTGLTPKEIVKRNEAYIEIMTRTYGPFRQKISQWLQADQAGRLVVLPGEEYCWRIRGDIAIGLILSNCRRAQEETGEATP